jgi:hypothetical protein
MCDFKKLLVLAGTWDSEGRLNPESTSCVVRLLGVPALGDSGPLSSAAFLWPRADTWKTTDSHSDVKLETNSSTIACSLLLMSIMGGRSTGSDEDDIFDVCDTWDRPGKAETLKPFAFDCHKH